MEDVIIVSGGPIGFIRVGRVLLAGDAAHVTNPTGGLGLTSGLFDSFALYPALGAVLLDRVSDSHPHRGTLLEGGEDHGAVDFLRQAGAHVEHLRLEDRHIHGNGHAMMLELNSDEIAGVLAEWIGSNATR